MSIESVVPPNHLFLWNPLLFFPSIFASIRVFSDELALHIRRPNYWSFSIGSSNEYSELISFRIDWFYLLDVQRTLKSLLQHHNSKASIFQHSAFFMVQLLRDIKINGSFFLLNLRLCGGEDESEMEEDSQGWYWGGRGSELGQSESPRNCPLWLSRQEITA